MPTGVPLNITIVFFSPWVAHAAWEPPLVEMRNGLIRDYFVIVVELDLGLASQYTTENSTLLLSDRHPYSTYHITLASRTVALGPFSAPATFQMPEARESSCVPALPLI